MHRWSRDYFKIRFCKGNALRPRQRSLIRRRAAKLNQIINQSYLHWFVLQIWARCYECMDVFRELFYREPAAYTL